MACSDEQKGDPCFKGKLAGQCPVHSMKSDDRVSPFVSPDRVWFDAFLRRNPPVAERNAECRGRGALTVSGLHTVNKWYSDAQKFSVENKMSIGLHDTG